MLEIGFFSLIVLAVSYWAILWVMGRREDVLHGEFVKGEAEPGASVRTAFSGPSVRPVFPARPVSAERPSLPERRVLAERVALPEKPAQAAIPEQPAFRPERL